jgi:hypothetical protein
LSRVWVTAGGKAVLHVGEATPECRFASIETEPGDLSLNSNLDVPSGGQSSDDNQATLVSTGTTLKLDAKVDVTFDVVVGKAGMRVS